MSVAPGNARTWNVYGKLSRLVRTVSPFDAAGTPNPTITEYGHDQDGRVVWSRAGNTGDDTKTTTSYDKRGQVVSRVSAAYDSGTVRTDYAYDEVAPGAVEVRRVAVPGLMPASW